ncbi:GlsB/YeaQ/YmgE family stress response membrane protein [Nocardioides jensenii]|uniref:GlsB/YeaQ/YmgE family stress response membrane protein n=1 Tax=Nocardioides jensenii TaxID=1843 RepID=UPI000830E38D|nr:hypothetical protein [Nocardioides jensenii]
MVIDMLWALIGGTVIGFLGKAAAPGDRDNIPLWLTVICGIGGVLIGTWAYTQFFDSSTGGVDWWRHIWQIVTAAILVMIAAGLTGRRR